MKNFATVVAFVLATTATPTFAQGATPQGPIGLRVEGRAGADIANISIEGVSEGKTGFDYSVEAGYDFNAAGVILGAYAGIGDSTTKSCFAGGTERVCLRSGRDITVGGRLGYSLSANSLVFAKGGYSNGRIRATYTDTAFPNDNFDEGENLDGFHVGAGIEFGIGQNAYVKGEYNYTNYSTGSNDFDVDSDVDRHRILAGVGIRF